jgi:hypothetical protein
MPRLALITRCFVLLLLLAAACAPVPDMNAAAEQALADGRASLAVLGVNMPTPPTEAAREPARIRPLRTEGLPPAGALRSTPFIAAVGLPARAAALSGNPPERILAWLGEPTLRRAEGPVSIWLYAAAGCQLDVMFYPSAEGPRVAYVQARAGGFAQRTEAACLHDLANQARRRAAPPAVTPMGDVAGFSGMLG